MAPDPWRVAFAGGGSGGHLVPAMAIAERLAISSPGLDAVVLCSHRPIDHTWLERAGLAHVPLSAQPFRPTPVGLLRFLRGHRKAVAEARSALRDHRSELLVAVGGFASVPGVLAARRLGVPVLLANLDARPGRANRFVAGRADRVVSAVEVEGDRRFSEVVGPPVRRSALAAGSAADARRNFSLDPGRPTLLVTGASHGATSINRFMIAWVARSPSDLDGWQVLHLTGGESGDVERAYREAGIPATVVATIDSMGEAWGAATLAISRAGANSVAEIGLNAVPSVLVPYPHHRDRHQWLNATPLVAAGGAVIAEDRIEPGANLESIGPACRRLLGDAGEIEAMRQRLRTRPSLDGAARIGEIVRELVDGRRARSTRSFR